MQFVQITPEMWLLIKITVTTIPYEPEVPNSKCLLDSYSS